MMLEGKLPMTATVEALTHARNEGGGSETIIQERIVYRDG